MLIWFYAKKWIFWIESGMEFINKTHTHTKLNVMNLKEKWKRFLSKSAKTPTGRRRRRRRRKSSQPTHRVSQTSTSQTQTQWLVTVCNQTPTFPVRSKSYLIKLLRDADSQKRRRTGSFAFADSNILCNKTWYVNHKSNLAVKLICFSWFCCRFLGKNLTYSRRCICCNTNRNCC